MDSRIKRNENNQNAVIASIKRRIEKLEKKNKGFEEESKSEKGTVKLTDYYMKLQN
ncbi:hypothetical protein ACQVPY_12475 [Bacillus pretiosus]|uniref:hypothetical protein n=1 Tax=Bacillus pretiosus TaxID=2983392 RepID=UPI003D64585A